MKKGDIIKKVSLCGEQMEFNPPIVARVTWVIDGQVSAQDTVDTNGNYIFSLGDEDWKVIQESSQSFQSQVANLSDEELRASIDSLRNGRAPRVSEATKKPKAPKKSGFTTEEDKLGLLLSSMSPQEQLELKKKLGLA